MWHRLCKTITYRHNLRKYKKIEVKFGRYIASYQDCSYSLLARNYSCLGFWQRQNVQKIIFGSWRFVFGIEVEITGKISHILFFAKFYSIKKWNFLLKKIYFFNLCKNNFSKYAKFDFFFIKTTGKTPFLFVEAFVCLSFLRLNNLVCIFRKKMKKKKSSKKFSTQ